MRAAGEPVDAFEAYRLYEAMGGTRTLAQVAAVVELPVTRVAAWSKEFDWKGRLEVRRADALEMERSILEAVKVDQAAERRRRIEEVREEEWDLAKRLIEAGRKCLATLAKKAEPSATPHGIAVMLELASKLMRLSQGMATERAEVVGEDGGPLKMELVAALEKVYGPQKTAGEVVDVQVEPAAEAPTGDALGLRAPPPSAP